MDAGRGARIEEVNLGVPSCRDALTPSTRLVSIRRGRGWFLFRLRAISDHVERPRRAAQVGDYTYVKYLLPTRGSIGLRTNLLSATRGTAVIDSNFDSYRAFAGDIEARDKGSLLAFEDGEATSHGLLGAQDRGQLFATPKTAVYKDMVVGVHQRPGDLRVNVCKQKQLTNMRSATKGIVEGLSPPLELTLDSAVEYISEEELVEVTPESIRMAKQRGWNDKKKGKK